MVQIFFNTAQRLYTAFKVPSENEILINIFTFINVSFLRNDILMHENKLIIIYNGI